MVDPRDVMDLRDQTARITQTLVQQEGVLFGQRCLSCNRTFVDQIQTANGVELEKERQRSALLHEVEQAYNSTDGGSVRFLSINVGKSGQQRGTDGGLYNTSDTSAEDMGGFVPISNLNVMAMGQPPPGSAAAADRPQTSNAPMGERPGTSPVTSGVKRLEKLTSLHSKLGNPLGTPGLGQSQRQLIGSLDPVRASKQKIAEKQLSDLVSLNSRAENDMIRSPPMRRAELSALPAPHSPPLKQSSRAISAPMAKLSSQLQSEYASSFESI